MRISRRTFLQGAAAVPIGAGLGASRASSVKPHVVVIGAGAFGGWSALHLLKLGADVTIIDRWGAGNALSSSGGKSRVIRSIYGPDRIYSEMVKRAYELWEALPESVYVETGALWMMHGDDGYVRAAVPLLRENGFAVDQISIDGAARRWLGFDAWTRRLSCTVVLDIVM